MNADVEFRQMLLDMLSQSQTDDSMQLNRVLWMLGAWRSQLIQDALLQHQGAVVATGPMAGLDFPARSNEGRHIAKWLGCYEQPLASHIEAAIGSGYTTFLNIGCADGYYAVGMARRMPGTHVFAFDIDPAVRAVCADMAARNGVSERVTIGALFELKDFASYAGKRTLVLCDIEGAEKELLDPAKASALVGMDVIVESHECLSPGITQILVERFEATHEITLVLDNGQRQLPPDMTLWFQDMPHLDQLLAVWEWRGGPTPWLVMKARLMTPPGWSVTEIP